MKISLASIVILIIVIYILFWYNSGKEKLLALFTLNLLYEGFINVGFFVSIGNQSFRVCDFLQLVMAGVSFLILVKRTMSKQLFLFFASVLMSFFLLAMVPLNELVRSFNSVDYINRPEYMHYPGVDMQAIKTTLRLLCFTWNATAIAQVITLQKWNIIRKKYFKAGRIVIVYAWLEFIIKNIIGNTTLLRDVFAVVFGADMTIMSQLKRNNMYVICGFNNEPSQFSMMLFSYLIIYIVGREWENQTIGKKLLTWSSLLLMVLSSSFRTVAMIPILVVLYLIVSRNLKHFVAIMGAGGIGIAVMWALGMLDYYVLRLTRALQFLVSFDPTGIGGGEAGRLYTIVAAIREFIKRPLFGIGAGQTFAYGFIPSILAMLGLAGTLTWYGVMFGSIGRVSIRNRITRRNFQVLLVISAAWIFTDSIGIGYSICVCAIAFEMWRVTLLGKQGKQEELLNGKKRTYNLDDYSAQ